MKWETGTTSMGCRKSSCEANDQATAWAVQWGSKLVKREEAQWPQDMGDVRPRLMVHAILRAAMTFPVGTGLGWDVVHPRAICRLSEDTLEWLVEVIHHCEITGSWPMEVDIVVIALLPKSDGGLRPTGLMPFLPRI